MMKLAKRTFALAMCAIMLISCCVFSTSASASVSMTKVDGHNITSGGEVVWSEYSVYGGNTRHTEKADILEFNPSKGYMPMVFTKYAGSVTRLPDQFNDAQNKYGYEVAGIINGSYFDTATGNLIGMIISNGRIMCGHNAYSDSVVAFTPDGKMHVVDTKIEYNMTINGQQISDAIRYINKRFDVDQWTVSQFYYYDTSCGNKADSSSTGYEIVCQKVQNSDLMVGGTLFAKVVEVRKDKGPSYFETDANKESDKFVLYCRSTSTYAPIVQNLKAGDDITITATETVAASKQIMETANSVITNVGWLVKNGVDQTDINSSVGGLSVDAYYRSTVFGTKPDGTYVFLVSDGGSTGDSSRSLSPREIAATMIKLGCNNVIRMDGGGSAAMYSTNVDGKGTDGYHNVYNDGGYVRPVADSIMIVKKTSAQDTALNTALKNAIADAKKYLATTSNATLSAYVAEAEAAFAKGAVVESEARRLFAKLSGKSDLLKVLEDARAISYKDYTESTLSEIRKNYDAVLAAYYSATTSVSDVAKLSAALEQSLNQGEYTNLSKGKSYTTSTPYRKDSWDDNKISLTDGSKSNKEAHKATTLYSGWNTTSVDVTVDLGSVVSSDTYTIYGASNFWGIKAANQLKISVSTDGKTFTDVGTSTTVKSLGNGATSGSETIALYSLTVKANSAQSARYVKFNIKSPKFVWIDEVEVGRSNNNAGETVGDAVEAHGFNQYIYDSNCFIYTPDFGTLTAGKINHKYTTNVILEATSKSDEWKIVSVGTNYGTAANVTLKSNQIMIACHSGNTSASKVSQAILKGAKVGDTLKFYGINVAKKSIGVAAYIQIVGDDNNNNDKPVLGKLGDVNNDGAIDQYDYILVKRHYFETRTLTDDEFSRADVNKDTKVDQFDYILIARHYFGTYVIK